MKGSAVYLSGEFRWKNDGALKECLDYQSGADSQEIDAVFGRNLQ